MIRPRPYLWLLGLAMVTTTSACAPSKVSFATAPDLAKYRIQTVAVVPFETLATPQYLPAATQEISVPAGAKRSDITVSIPPAAAPRSREVTVTVPEPAAERVTGLVYSKLSGREGVKVLEPAGAARVLRSLMPEERSGGFEQRGWRVATKIGADAALVGRVLVYQERGGSKLGGNPAEVGFEVKLVGPEGITLWTGNYYERQRPFNEDAVGSIQRGFVFVTAAELAEYGAEHLIKAFPLGANPSR